jgi:hypothetical protein
VSGTLPLREAALAAIAARLATTLPDVVVERARRAAVDTDAETLPRLVLRGDDLDADDSQEPGRTHYQIGFVVAGYAAGSTDLAAEQALSLLHARVVAALAGWTPSDPGLGDVAERRTEFVLYAAEDSARPTGEFQTRFVMLVVAPSGGPFST